MDDKLNAALKGIWESLTDEQKEKAKTCKSWDELTALAGKEGIELPDEVLDAVAGGILYARSYDKDWAVEYARSRGQSTEEISLDRVNLIRADFEKRNSSGC